MQIPPGKKIYFLSDFHLGAPNEESSLEREKRIVRFLDETRADAFMIFIVGDMFDFWYEYRKVVPKGGVRLLGKIAELTDAGIGIHFFVGNHDMWMRQYFQKELNVPVYFEPKTFEFNGKSFYIGHGDGLGPGDHGYKAMKKVFRNPVCHWMFGILPPFIGVGIANYFSHKSRSATGDSEENFLGEEKEWLLIYSKEMLKQQHFDFFVFGHRHLPIDYRLKDNSRYINLGEWMNFSTYAIFDGTDMEVRSYSGMEHKIYKNW
ncbi:UDP-2,3-diacylglucosamine diphosphatase [Flavisolibacter ginsengisoli]|jgi:UDP-2,3-diacylglucosamine hydrolase|uniref:UDP-2,3-diacylglucosamine hydrolase n=1 Tax=Flavisolibacter ginsengisoli DSM 18119 TaxID=1121884 RepID=A0A1M5DJ17_9BACT|nr:UDP-2,3-diacylglucosamine diphosphatase [Flavisolibacter ginsengisoli]SHF67018.1 UDP-2,3-diacylglucosamine hydrolase [Flavisolibacter ginsengisoli DSM 18119]